MILNTSISINSNYYHHHHRVQVQGPHQPSCFGLLGISTSSKRLSHENGFHSYNHISRSSSNCSIRLRMALFEDNGKDLEMLDMDDYDVIEECKLPPDFNAIMLKDFKCTPDDIDKKYWELLSTGSDIHRTHTATGESYNKESSVDDDTDTDTTENLSNVLEGSPEVLSTTLDQVMTLFPVVAPIFAFLTYPMLIPYFDSFVDAIATTVSTKNWLNVDGGAYQAELITPAINGIVIPAVSILFATMISQTVTTLRQRQVDVRTCLNVEASEIRILQCLVESFADSDIKNILRKDLTSYTLRIISESAPVETYSCFELVESEMNDFFGSLNKMSSKPDIYQTNPALLSEASSAVVRLNNQRSSRISALQTTFPIMHYLVLSTLALSICLAFLLETNQKALVFLATTELRFLWTMLIGAFSALSAICYDLLHPFRGNYQIVISVVQFYKIRDSLIATEKMKRGVLDLSMSSSIK